MIIGSFRFIIDFMLCFLFLSMSIKPKNMIYQIDSLGNILIVKQTNHEPTRESELVSEMSFGSLPRISVETHQKDLLVPTYSDY